MKDFGRLHLHALDDGRHLTSQAPAGFSEVFSGLPVAKHNDIGTGGATDAGQHSVETSEDAVLKGLLKES